LGLFFRAHDRMLGRDVALKVLREDYAKDAAFVSRFQREAVSAAALNHPYVVQVYDQGHTEDGRYYIAMEHVPGGNLKDRIDSTGPLEPAEAALLASQVADALGAAHERGIVHRDIKPQNVLLDTAAERPRWPTSVSRWPPRRTLPRGRTFCSAPRATCPQSRRWTSLWGHEATSTR
jgi:serine/threonine protein kinase